MIRLIALIIIVLICFIIGLIIGLNIWLSTPVYKGPKSDHFDGRIFYNMDRKTFAKQPSFFGVIREAWTTDHQKEWPEHVEVAPQTPPKPGPDEVVITFVNHATVLIQWKGMAFVTDPHWTDRASPVTFSGPKRVHVPGVRWEDLPPINGIFLSHNHYDHLDAGTLARFARQGTPPLFAGLGHKKYLERFGVTDVREMDWWDNVSIAGDVTLTFVPAQHFSARSIWDRNRALWGGFVLELDGFVIYFAGDTAAGPHFEEIAKRFPKIDLALIPIGAYEPRWFMKFSHVNPEEAVQAHQILKPDLSIGIHWGTFQLTFEGREEPLTDLETARKRHGVPDAAFIVLQPGESKIIPHQ